MRFLPKKLPPVTCVMVVLNLIGLIYEMIVGENRAIYQYCMYQGAIEDGEVIRIFTNAFLHFGFAHFASNMICLLAYGFDLENKIGSARYAAVYAASIVGAGLLINFRGGNGLHAGASGAVWGLMTATLIYNLKHGRNISYAFRGILLNLVYSFSANVSWQGHIGGGIAGLLAALVLCGSHPNRSLPEAWKKLYPRDRGRS